MSAPEEKMLTLKTSDNQEFLLEESIAIQCSTIKHLVEDCASSVIPLPNISSGSTMAKIVEYLKHHADKTTSDNDKKKFDDQFFNVPIPQLFELILAVNYLDHPGMMDKCSAKIADAIKNKSPEKVRQIFGIDNDYTPEEEAEIRKEYEWTFEGIDAD